MNRYQFELLLRIHLGWGLGHLPVRDGSPARASRDGTSRTEMGEGVVAV